MPSEWKQEGGVTKVVKYRYFRIDLMNMPSLENATDAQIRFMDEFDREEYEAMAGE